MCMVGKMVQNSQKLHLFTFKAVVIIHIQQHTNSHLKTSFLFNIIFTHIYGMYSSTLDICYVYLTAFNHCVASLSQTK